MVVVNTAACRGHQQHFTLTVLVLNNSKLCIFSTQFVTTAYVTLFAVSDCGLDSVDQRPSDYPSQVSLQMDWLSDLAHRLVDLVWMPPPQEDINTAAAAAGRRDEESEKKIFPFCYCREGKSPAGSQESHR